MSKHDEALMALVEKARLQASINELEWMMHNMGGGGDWRRALFTRLSNLEKEYEAIC